MPLNDLERAQLKRVRSRITEALSQATALAEGLRGSDTAAGVDNVEQAVVDLKRALAEVDALDR